MQFQQKQGGDHIKGSKSTYQIEEKIGEGSGGQVYRGRDIKNNTKVAIKIQKTMEEAEKAISQLFSTKEFKHLTNIIEFLETSDQNYVIIMDYCNGGDLFNYLQNQNLNYKRVMELFQQIVEGVQELHNLNLIHRDLKPENILVFIDVQTGVVTLKLCDFGLVKKENKAKTMNIGTPYYMAPELIGEQQAQIDSSIDIWALGCIWYEMLSNQLLFDGESAYALCQKVKQTKQKWIDKQIDNLICCGQKVNDSHKKLLKRMICIDKDKRFDALKVIQTLNGSEKYLNTIGLSQHFQTKPIKVINLTNNSQKAELEKQKEQSKKKEVVGYQKQIQNQEEELKQKLNYEHQQQIQEMKQKQEKEFQDKLKYLEVQKVQEKQRYEEELRKKDTNEQKIQQKLKELEEQKQKEQEEKLKIEREKQAQELQEFNRQKDEIMKQKLQEQEQQLRKELEEQLRREQENQIKELKKQSEEYQRMNEEKYKNQLEELEKKFKDSNFKDQENQAQLEAEKIKLEEQYKQDMIKKQNEQLQKEQQLKERFNREKEEYEQEQLQKLRIQVTEKKTKYETAVQRFNMDQKEVINRLQQGSVKLSQLQLELEPSFQQNINLEQVELENQIKKIDQKFELLSQFNLACIQRKSYLNLENDLNNQQNKYFNQLKLQVNELKSNLRILSDQELQEIDEIINKYKQEEFDQKLQERDQIIQEQGKQLQQLQQEKQQEQLKQQDQLKWQINNMNNQLNDLKQKYEKDQNQFLQSNKTVLEKLQKHCFDIKQLKLNLEELQYHQSLQDQIDQLTQQIKYVQGKQSQLDQYNQACQQKKVFFEFEDNLNQKNSNYQKIKQEIEKFKESIILQQHQQDFINRLIDQYNKEEQELIKQQQDLEFKKKLDEEVQKRVEEEKQKQQQEQEKYKQKQQQELEQEKQRQQQELEQEKQKQQQELDQHKRKVDEEIKKQQQQGQQNLVSQQLQDKHNKYQNKVHQYVQYVESINHSLQKDFKGLLGISSQQYQQLESSKMFLKELQKIAQLYQTELRQFEYKGEEQKIEYNEANQEEQLKEVEQQLETIISKQAQIQRDQERLQELNQQQMIIKEEYKTRIYEQENQIEKLEEEVAKGYKRKLESFELYKEDFKKNKYATDDLIDKEFKELTEKFYQEQQKFKENCNLPQQKQQQTLEEYIILHDQIVRVIQILSEKEQELNIYDAKKYFGEFKDNLIYKPKNQQAYSMNKVKLRAKVKDQALIRQVLRIQDIKDNKYQEQISDIKIQRYDELMKQINI